jgi:hypothetical protein
MWARLLLVPVVLLLPLGSPAIAGGCRLSCAPCYSTPAFRSCDGYVVRAAPYRTGRYAVRPMALSERHARAIAEAFPPPPAQWRFDLRTRVITVHSPW